MEGEKLNVSLRMSCKGGLGGGGAAFQGNGVREESGLGIASPRRERSLV